jgi:uncharacterized protein (DUF362 family)
MNHQHLFDGALIGGIVMDRRSFIRVAAPFVGSVLGSQALSGCRRAIDILPTMTPTDSHLTLPTQTPAPDPTATIPSDHATIFIVKTDDRMEGVWKALSYLEAHSFQDKKMLVKPNLNSSHDTPGSTHNEVLFATLRWLNQNGADQITIGDRSGMENTRRVMEKKGLFAIAESEGADLIAFDELGGDAWEHYQFEGSHWPSGFAVARPVLEADGIVSLCCLKTHRFGGHFTLSLKNSVGMVAYMVPGESIEYMSQLHTSENQRRMIADINTTYEPDFVILDAVDAFTHGGPDTGTLAHPGLILAGTDRVAMDAVGVAILRYLGTTHVVESGRIFEQEQIERAVSLGLGVDHPEKIDLITDDPESNQIANDLRTILLEG